MTELFLSTWDDFKTFITTKQLFIQFIEYQNRYELIANEAIAYAWRYTIYKSNVSETEDFETNYKASSNIKVPKTFLVDNEGNFLTSTTLGGKQSLDVNIVNSFAAGVEDSETFTYGTSIANAIAGVYSDSNTTVSSGNQAAVRITAERGLHTNLRNSSGSELGTSSNPLVTSQTSTYRNITGNATVTVKSSSGVLKGIMINKNWTGGTITIYDNTTGSGTKIATLDTGTPSGGLLSTSGVPSPTFFALPGIEFSTGLTVVTSGSSNNDITILYK